MMASRSISKLPRTDCSASRFCGGSRSAMSRQPELTPRPGTRRLTIPLRGTADQFERGMLGPGFGLNRGLGAVIVSFVDEPFHGDGDLWPKLSDDVDGNSVIAGRSDGLGEDDLAAVDLLADLLRQFIG